MVNESIFRISAEPVSRSIAWKIAMHKTERIAGSEKLARPDIIYSAFTGLKPDGSPIMLVIHGLYDIYRLDLLLP